MTAPERPVWLPARHYEAFGVPFAVRVTDESLLSLVDRHLPSGTRQVSGPPPKRAKVYGLALDAGGGSTVHNGSRGRFQTSSVESGLLVLGGDVELHVATYTAERVFIHAGAAAYRGAGIILPGTTFAGKSSLVIELVRAGALYYSDEYAVVDRGGMLHPYGRAPQTRDASGRLRTIHAIESVGRVGGGPVPVRMVVSTSYEPGASWRPRPMQPAETLLALFPHAIPMRIRPAATLDTLQRVVMGAAGIQSVRGEAVQTAPLLLEALARFAED